MGVIELCNIKGSYEIITCNDYIIFFGPELVIFQTDGTFIACRKDLGKVRKCVCVCADTLLVDYSSRNFYSLISLIDGSELWRTSQPKLDYTCGRFVLSPDKRYAYDLYTLRGKYCYVEIDLISGNLRKQRIKHDMRCVSDLACDQQGNPVFLEHHYEESKNEAKKSVSKNGTICVSAKDRKYTHSFIQTHQWELPYPQIARFFLKNEDVVLTQDLQVYIPSTGEMYSLAENEKPLGNPGGDPADYRLDMKSQYLILMYDTVNVVVDCVAQRIVARYAAQYRFGHIVGNEYWICTDEGIIRKPFPIIEDIPRRYNFWSP